MHESPNSVISPRHSYNRILALDLGKFNSVLCDYDPPSGKHRFESLATTSPAIHDLLSSVVGVIGA